MFRSLFILLLFIIAGSSSSSSASTNCCRLIKIDPDTPPITLRACTIDDFGACDGILFLGTLALGESQEVCTDQTTILYEEYDDAEQAFGPATEALCDTDVEL